QFMPAFPLPPKPNGEDWNRYQRLKEPAQPYLRHSLEAQEIRCDVKDAAERQVLRDNAGKDRKEPDDKLANQVHAGKCTHIFDCGIVIGQRSALYPSPKTTSGAPIERHERSHHVHVQYASE